MSTCLLLAHNGGLGLNNILRGTAQHMQHSMA
jgi:hypothetical protein